MKGQEDITQEQQEAIIWAAKRFHHWTMEELNKFIEEEYVADLAGLSVKGGRALLSRLLGVAKDPADNIAKEIQP